MAGFPKPKKYTPMNPSKVIGDPTNIIARSSWETRVFKKLDESSAVLRWGSECLEIKYVSPKDNRVHRYYPDLLVVARGPNGPVTTLIEIKPYKQSVKPSAQGKSKDRFINESMVYLVNQAKWKAAEAFCASKGITFAVMTENEIFPK